MQTIRGEEAPLLVVLEFSAGGDGADGWNFANERGEVERVRRVVLRKLMAVESR
jgi:hypothetical protein